MDNDMFERMAYRLIRIEVRRYDRETTDSELANYVRGVVDMQTELYSETIREINEQHTRKVESYGLEKGE